MLVRLTEPPAPILTVARIGTAAMSHFATILRRLVNEGFVLVGLASQAAASESALPSVTLALRRINAVGHLQSILGELAVPAPARAEEG